MKVFLNKTNHKELDLLVKNLGRQGVAELEIVAGMKPANFSFAEIMPLVYRALDQEAQLGVWLINFPYCVLNKNSRDHNHIKGNKRGEKVNLCKQCFYFKDCPGFPVGYFAKYGQGEVYPIIDLPLEVMIEVESRCNFECQFCFNKNSFAKNGRDKTKLTDAYVKKIINDIYKSGIKIVRFTGGEPLLREDIFLLMSYAKSKGLEVRLNTNGSLVNSKNVKKIAGLVDNVLIPIESSNYKTEASLTGFADSLGKKIAAVKILKKAGVPIVRVGTVISQEVIKNFNSLAGMILSLPIDEWEFYRPTVISSGHILLKHKDMEFLIKKIWALRKKTDKIISVANSFPLCFVRDRNKANAVCSGAALDEGHGRLVVDPRGFVKPHYFIDINIGEPLKILAAWKHPFMKRMRRLQYLPEMCRACRFKYKCRGGSRYAAKIISGDWRAPDPLIARR